MTSVYLPPVATPAPAPVGHDRYDAVTIAFHWATAALVLVLFGTALLWQYAPRDWGLRSLQDIHVSLGIALAAVLVGRLAWRFFAARRLPAEGTGLTKLLSRIVHFGLYALLAVQVVLGFGTQWFGGEALDFFGWFSIPSPFAGSRAVSHQLETLHNIVAWSLIYLVGGHAGAALVHRYVFKDGVLKRMLPIAG
jgi:cytochrome b561